MWPKRGCFIWIFNFQEPLNACMYLCVYLAAFSFKWVSRLAKLYAGYSGILQWNTQETGSERGKAGKAAMFVINWPYLPFAPGATWKKKKKFLRQCTDSVMLYHGYCIVSVSLQAEVTELNDIGTFSSTLQSFHLRLLVVYRVIRI